MARLHEALGQVLQTRAGGEPTRAGLAELTAASAFEPFNVRLAIKAARLAAALGDGAAGETAALLQAAAAAVDGLAAAEALPPHDLADLAGGVRVG